MRKKNEIVPLTITGMTAEGNGVGRSARLSLDITLNEEAL